MSTLVSLLLAAVLNLLGNEVRQEVHETASIEIVNCHSNDSILTPQCINQNEQLFKVKEITYEN
tara:strand:+ start:627 stop:818 length:192 start_codon:yes stop_codon:yes gene_type:complete